ncbi:hypothetical protein CTAM01_05248 [Colletotrichum tamarilloi]|uniref:Uncharacterized protein n=1 Tax=Colletotrichum tamarilloi TaxID=1209934 RepID=A0ABQ9RF94_9PEZI|nr:uncharacterized protein CTAM01_05248 [Colletotrichum tamarilloi]KAK1502435.1 hypothetical protein CTAM01_05248 [Colletotrichum tamarilloi]
MNGTYKPAHEESRQSRSKSPDDGCFYGEVQIITGTGRAASSFFRHELLERSLPTQCEVYQHQRKAKGLLAFLLSSQTPYPAATPECALRGRDITGPTALPPHSASDRTRPRTSKPNGGCEPT